MERPVFQEALVKLATRCNLNCTYCYWFRDASVYSKPPILTSEAEHAFLARLEEHLRQYQLKHFSLILHGGEPLLFGKRRFVAFMDQIDAIEEQTGCAIQRSLTTNGVLIDEEWARLFRLFRLHVTVSIDGSPAVHNRARIDFQGRGTYHQVTRGIQMLRQQHLEPGVLAVCDPTSDPVATLTHFVEELGLRSFDILIPDATHDDHPVSIAPYYLALFDRWYEHYRPEGVVLRSLQTMVSGLIASLSSPDSQQYNPVGTLTVLTDGALEPVDVLRIAGKGSTHTELSVQNNLFQDLTRNALWREAYHATSFLPASCQQCAYRVACNGGYLPHRWSREQRYDNPSVYCSDLLQIYQHIWDRLLPDLRIVQEEQTQSVMEVLSSHSKGANYGLGQG